MVLWRICPFQDLNGEGGLLFPARWHFAGNPVVYLAESPAGALLEICANTTADDTSPTLTLLKVDGPDVSIAEIPPNTLPNDWTKRGSAVIRKKSATSWCKSMI